jgi:hypothetical protein
MSRVHVLVVRAMRVISLGIVPSPARFPNRRELFRPRALTDLETTPSGLPTAGRFSLSVVVPVHNGGLHLRDCLATLAQQREHFGDLLVVNDGSTDDAWKVRKSSERAC